MLGRIPLPTDNIYKFYALFGLILFIFGWSSVIYLNKSTNEFGFEAVIEHAALDAIEKRTAKQEAIKVALKRKVEIAATNKKFFLYCISAIIALSLYLMFYGFRQWHTKVQPVQDEIAELTLKKLRAEVGEVGGGDGCG